MSEHSVGCVETQIVLTVDDVFLRNEWTDGVPTVSLNEMKPEEDFDILDMLEDLHINATLFVCGTTAELFPDMMKKLDKKDFEIAAHGYRHENFRLLEEPEKGRRIQSSIEIIEKCMNTHVSGWRSPGLHIDAHSYKILESTHVLWCSNVELPLFFRQVPFMYYGKVELPIAVIDLKLYERGFSPARVRQMLLSILDRRGDVFTIVIHPWVQLRKAERMKALRDFLEAARSTERVRFSTGLDIYKQFISHRKSVYATALSTVSSMWKRVSSLKL